MPSRIKKQIQGLIERDKKEGEMVQADLQGNDVEYMDRVFAASKEAASSGKLQSVEPYSNVLKLTDGSEHERQEWNRHGLGLVAQGKAAILLLAGGQGTRLGSPLPKGCMDVGLPSGKTLFQIQAERILKLQQLASQEHPQQQPPKPMHWLIMTSPFTHKDTLSHFQQNDYFGLQPSQVSFFQQGWLPCFTDDGELILETPCTVAKAPDGNGGVFLALHKSGLLDMLAKEGVESVDCYCVDNLLARIGDPQFLGYCHSQGAEVGARVVARAHAQEKVGVFATRGGELSVVEYSELTPEQASACDPNTGELQFKWSNICMHYFSVSWLQKVHAHLAQGTAYHIARKQIPSKDGPVQGIKLELFIFDPFPIANKVALMEVARSEHFAPVKNARGSASDTPDTARDAFLALGAKWLRDAGAVLELPPGRAGVEVPASVSYGGKVVKGDLLQL